MKECDGCLKYVLEFQHNIFLKIFVVIKLIHQFKFKFLHLVVVKPRPQEIILYSQKHTRKGIGESYILNAKKNTQKLFYFFHFLCTFKNLREMLRNVIFNVAMLATRDLFKHPIANKLISTYQILCIQIYKKNPYTT